MPDNSAAELNDAIEAFIHDGHVEQGTPVFDIAQQVLSDGFDSLTPDQIRTFEGKLREILRRAEAP
jgi:hypothetical protein